MAKSLEKKIQSLFKGKNKKYVRVAFYGGSLLLFIILIVNLTVQRTYDSYYVVKEKARTDSSTKGYLKHNENIVKYSEDGITVMNTDLKNIWSASYNFKNPKVITKGRYVAVADIGGKEIHVYDDDGSLDKIESSKDICQIEMSDTGMVAVMAKEKMAYYITIIKNSKKYIDIKTRIKEDGYPIDMAFSHDSKKLVTSYAKVENGEMNNYVTFYNFSEVGKNYESKMVKIDSYGSVMVPKVEFMDKDTVCVFSGERFIVYAMKEVPEEKFKSAKFNKTIKSVLCSEDYIGVITDSDTGADSKLMLYTKDGREKLNRNFRFNYDNVEIINDDIIFNNGTDGLVIRGSGKTKFQGSFKEEVQYMMPYNKRDKYVLITPQSIERVRFTN